MDFQVVRTVPQEIWRTFVESHPKGNIFLTPEMFQVYQLTEGYTPELWAAMDNDRILALMIPVRIALRRGMVRWLTTRSVAFGGVLCVDSQDGVLALRKLLQQYKRQSGNLSLFTEIRNVSSPDVVGQVMIAAGFQYEDHLNYLIGLDSCTDTVFERIGSRTRKHIRRSLKRNDIRIVEVRDRNQIPLCYELLCQTYQNAHVPLSDLSLFYAAFDLLFPKGMVRFALAFINDEPAATTVDLLYKDVIYGWYGGSNRKFVSRVPNETIMWNVLEWGCRNNYHIYDFGGAGKPNEKYGVRDFKAKFGGELVCYGRNIWTVNPLFLALSKFAYNGLRRVIFSK